MIEEHIRIDENRFITVPKDLQRIAIQNDHNVETVTFDCPRYWDGNDMSEMRIYINYMCPDRTIGMYLAQNITIDDADPNTMHFDWTISRNATKVIGQLSFLVCVKKTDDFGYSINHWNSELNRQMYISEGLECEESILEAYPDIISYLLTRQDIIEGKSEEYVREHVMAYFEENPFAVDASLIQTGLAADAKVTGDNVKRLDSRIDTKKTLIKELHEIVDNNKTNAEQAVADLTERFEGHSARHAIDSEDPITPAMINAVNKDGDTFAGEDVYNGNGYGRWHASDNNTGLHNFDTSDSTDNGRGIEIANATKKPALKDAVQLHDIKEGINSRYNVLHSGAPDFAASTVLDGFPVGEIRQTTRLGLGDKWLKCDGRSVTMSQYKELCMLLPGEQAEFSIGTSSTVHSSNDSLLTIEEHNGTFVAISEWGCICVSTNPSAPESWTVIALPESVTRDVSLLDVIYAGDKWAVLGYTRSSSSSDLSYYYRLYTATDPLGEWAVHEIFTSENSSFKRLVYNNGVFAVAGKGGSYYSPEAIVYSTADPSSAWTETVVYTANSNQHGVNGDVQIACHDGQWIVITNYGHRTEYSSHGHALHVYLADNPASEWSLVFGSGKYLDDMFGSSVYRPMDTTINYVDDAWVVLWPNGYILKISDINKISYDNIQKLTGVSVADCGRYIKSCGGFYFLITKGSKIDICMASDINDAWNIVTPSASDIVVHENEWVALGDGEDGDFNMVTSSGRYLPNIASTNGINTFIKALP